MRRAGIRWSVVLAAALSLLLAACAGTTSGRSPSPGGGSPVPVSTPAPSPTPDLTQVQAAAYLIFPRGPATDCGTSAPTFDRCPFTPRLRERMQAIVNSFTAGGFDPVCRCQNSYESVEVTTEVLSGSPVAHVVLTFGVSEQKLDWVFVESAGSWLADDSYLTGQGPGTSIYDISTS